MRSALLLGLSVAVWPVSVVAQMPVGDPVVASNGPAAVSVTVYRAPDRGAGQAMDLAFLQGYALVTETREVDLPAGRSVVRFDGVAAGMLPESVIVSGLPAGVREKNLDADLLNPRNLYARAFGRPVILRRTDAAGHSREEPAVIRSGPDGAAVLQTAAGFENATCGPLHDQIVYQGVLPGLSPRPSLSIATDAPAAAHVRLTLSYLAWGFDWQANYVLRLKPGAKRAEMTAWVTLASSDSTPFPQAKAAVVAGKLQFDETRERPEEDGTLVMHCAMARPVEYQTPSMAMSPPPAPMMARADIMVTAMRVAAPMVVQQEALGDLKLYRVPVATTIAAHAQKQVALLDRRQVALELIYKADLRGMMRPGGRVPAQVAARLQNTRAAGLGLPLPAGQVRVVQMVTGDGAPAAGPDGVAVPAAAGHMDDKAQGEEIDIALGTAPGLQVEAIARGKGGKTVTYRVTNANPWPVRFEGRVADAPVDRGAGKGAAAAARADRPIVRRNGQSLWQVRVPAHGQAILHLAMGSGTPG